MSESEIKRALKKVISRCRPVTFLKQMELTECREQGDKPEITEEEHWLFLPSRIRKSQLLT